MLKPINLKATSLSDAWYQTMYSVIDHGRKFKIDEGSFEGSYRYELDHLQIHITYPDKGELLPQIPSYYNIPNPVEEDYLNDYMPYLMTDEEKEGESYTYGQRIWGNISCGCGILKTSGSQIDILIQTYRENGYRNNQMILQIAKPDDILLNDPPCLRHIDTRIQDGKLHFFPYFRSWDLFSGLPANLAGIEILKQYCASEIGVENGEMIASTKGGHIYDYAYDIAKTLRGK